MSNSVRPHRRQPTRLPHPWDSPGKNTGVGCHFLLQCMQVKNESEVTQSCLTLSDPIDCSPPGSPVPGILLERMLEWVAISFSNAWKWKVKVKSLSCVRLFGTPWTAAHQTPLSMGFSSKCTGVGCHRLLHSRCLGYLIGVLVYIFFSAMRVTPFLVFRGHRYPFLYELRTSRTCPLLFLLNC